MTISSTNNQWPYNGDGSTTAFAYDNKIFTDTDLEVYVDAVLQTISTDYTVSGVGEETGGNVTFVTAPVSGTNNVLILRDVPDTQARAFPPAGPFPAKAVEDALDKLTILIQQLVELQASGNASLTPDASGNDTIAHGLAGIPTSVTVGIRGDNVNGVDVESVDATDITVRIKDAAGADVTSGTFTVDWNARFTP